MASNHFSSSLSEKLIDEVESTLDPSSIHGADLRFHGVVRDREDGRKISGIDYSFYGDMALQELNRIGEAMGKEYPGHLALVHHRIGFVPAGEASILIRVQTAHSAEGFEVSREYLRRIKETVPIWKEAVFLEE
ncbi:MAG: molybdenum cofactor biosynthesis protein MoaE [Verrucomicrobiales bacterium]|nr:molybdenum cofactor biosynthesis protein MoaE [Verrucomicrobiales bacterium]